MVPLGMFDWLNPYGRLRKYNRPLKQIMIPGNSFCSHVDNSTESGKTAHGGTICFADWRARVAKYQLPLGNQHFRTKKTSSRCDRLNLTRHEQDACDPKKIENFSLKICVCFDQS
jgi:hypothetical protein